MHDQQWPLTLSLLDHYVVTNGNMFYLQDVGRSRCRRGLLGIESHVSWSPHHIVYNQCNTLKHIQHYISYAQCRNWAKSSVSIGGHDVVGFWHPLRALDWSWHIETEASFTLMMNFMFDHRCLIKKHRAVSYYCSDTDCYSLLQDLRTWISNILILEIATDLRMFWRWSNDEQLYMRYCNTQRLHSPSGNHHIQQDKLKLYHQILNLK